MKCCLSGQEARLDRLLSEGMVLLSRSKMGLANLFIPGYWKHAAICTSDAASGGQGCVVEATLGRGVVERSLEDFIQDKQDIAVLRPRIPASALREVAAEAGKRVGAAYDFGFFDHDNGHYYCSKLVSDCLRAVTGREPCPLRRVWGRRVVTAHDFYERRHSFEVVYEARGRSRSHGCAQRSRPAGWAQGGVALHEPPAVSLLLRREKEQWNPRRLISTRSRRHPI